MRMSLHSNASPVSIMATSKGLTPKAPLPNFNMSSRIYQNSFIPYAAPNLPMTTQTFGGSNLMHPGLKQQQYYSLPQPLQFGSMPQQQQQLQQQQQQLPPPQKITATRSSAFGFNAGPQKEIFNLKTNSVENNANPQSALFGFAFPPPPPPPSCPLPRMPQYYCASIQTPIQSSGERLADLDAAASKLQENSVHFFKSAQKLSKKKLSFGFADECAMIAQTISSSSSSSSLSRKSIGESSDANLIKFVPVTASMSSIESSADANRFLRRNLSAKVFTLVDRIKRSDFELVMYLFDDYVKKDGVSGLCSSYFFLLFTHMDFV